MCARHLNRRWIKMNISNRHSPFKWIHRFVWHIRALTDTQCFLFHRHLLFDFSSFFYRWTQVVHLYTHFDCVENPVRIPSLDARWVGTFLSLSVCVTDFSQKSYLLCISFGDSSNIPFEYKYMQCTFACVTCKYQSTNLGTNKSNKFLRIMCQSWEKINSTKEKKCFNSYPFTRKTKAIFFPMDISMVSKVIFSLSFSLDLVIANAAFGILPLKTKGMLSECKLLHFYRIFFCHCHQHSSPPTLRSLTF